MRTRSLVALSIPAFVFVAGCQSTDWLAGVKPKAVQVAEARGRSELNCPAAAGTVLSDKPLPPEFQSARFRTPDRGVFTVGVDGCGKRTSYIVVCERDLAQDCAIAGGPR